MADVRDVAAAIIEAQGSLDTLTLHKLLYYSEGYYLAWYGESLFDEPIEAWRHGPVVRVIYNACKGQPGNLITDASAVDGDVSALSEQQLAAVGAVVRAYGSLTGLELRRKTHESKPWIEARGSLGAMARSTEPLSRQTMREYFLEAPFGVRTRPLPEPDATVVSKTFQGSGEALGDLFASLGVEVETIIRA